MGPFWTSCFGVYEWLCVRRIRSTNNRNCGRRFKVQDRQCTCNVTLWHVHATIFAVEKQYILRMSVASVI